MRVSLMPVRVSKKSMTVIVIGVIVRMAMRAVVMRRIVTRRPVIVRVCRIAHIVIVRGVAKPSSALFAP